MNRYGNWSLKNQTKIKLLSILFALPALSMVAYALIIPAIWNLILSFQSGTGFFSMEWSGVSNYIKLFHDKRFLTSLYNSVFISVLTTLLAMIFGIILALLMYRLTDKEGAFYRLIVFMPAMIPSAIIALMFAFLLNPEMGIINNLLRAFGAEGLTRAWLSESPLNVYVIVAVGVWRMVGLPLILIFAALQAIPTSFLEAGKLEGANYFQQVYYLLLPLLKPIIAIAASFLLIVKFKSFDLVYVLTGGGPGYSTSIVPVNIYKTAFEFLDFGYSASMGVMLILCILIVNFIFRVLFRSETYEY